MVRLVGDQLFGDSPDGRVVDPDLIDGGLRSKQFATVVDLLGYGEIDGVFDEGGVGSSTFRKNVFLDRTPLQNPLGQENFTDVEVFVKNGASNQTALQEINAIENTIPVGVALTNSPFATTKTGTYTLAGSDGQTVSGVALTANQMLVEIANHGYFIGEVVHWTNTSPLGTVQTDNPQTQNIVSVPDSGKFVINTTFENTSFAGDCTVKTSQGLSRTISNTDVDKVRVTIQFPSLQEFKEDGDVIGAEVKISIRIIENNGTNINPVVLDITNGKATSPYAKDYEIVFERAMNFPLTLSVFRNTDDDSGSRLQNSTTWLSYTEINTDTSAYQGFAYVALRFNAQEFQSYPRRMYRIKGTKIKVPHGTTIDSTNGRVIYPDGYTFNGTFKTDKEWCADPAWILYDILTTDKGFGGTDGIVQEENLDVFSFYSASAYASTLITDPITNTTEPRFSCNVILNQRNDAYNLINDLCSVMNAMPFYSNGTLQISQDRPTNTSTNTSDAQYVFNNSNVTEEGFVYQSQAARLKYTEVEVQYFDNETQSMEFELITADQITALGSGSTGIDAINKFGRTRKTIRAFACTSIGQANRLGRWFLYSNLLENEVVTFTTTLEAGVIVRPATIIAIADSVRSGVRKGGRINTGVSTTQIIVDARSIDGNDLSHESGSTLSVVLPDGSTESKTISSIDGTTITVSSAFSSTPQANSVYAIESPSTKLQIFKVISIEEKDNSEYTISAIIHDTDKYAQVEDTTVAFNPKTISTLIGEKNAPSNLAATEQIVLVNDRAVSKIFVTWQPVQGVKEYLLEFQYENNNPERIRLARPDFELFESRLGSYTFKVKSFNSLGVLSSNTSTVNFQAVGKTALPADPSGLTMEPISDRFVRLRFDASTDLDVLHGGTIAVRHSSNTSRTETFQNSIDIIPRLSGTATEAIVPALTGTYFIKFIDDGGRKSSNAAKIIVTAPDPQPHQIILTEREDTDGPPFQGEKVNTFYDATFDGLLLSGTLLIDDITQNIDDLSNIDFASPIASSGSYEFNDVLDLESKFNLSLLRKFTTFGILPNDLLDSRTANIDTWTEFDGTLAEDVNASLLVATTDISPTTSVSATYEQSAFTITVTKASHGYLVGDFVVITFTGGATSGNYEIQSTPDGNTFTVTSTTSTTISSGTACTYGANFTQFNTFTNGEYTARGFKFKTILTSNDPAQNINVTELGYTATVRRRVETVNTSIASGTSAKTVTFTHPFFIGTASLGGSSAFLPTIGITLEGAVSGDYFKITSITGTQFVIEVRDSSNNFKDLNFKYSAIGYGKGG
jgi:predicted phage tail protein|tara:strand:+ start:3260 stop:7171 length:3912 start_codon:yes stop_codon:yes gene_type:complete